MKKILIGFILISLFFSCNKEEELIQKKDVQKVLLNVSTFRQSFESLKSNPVDEEVDKLTCVVYKENGEYVHTIEQTKDNADFGTISDELEVGSYNFVLGAWFGNEISIIEPDNYSRVRFGMNEASKSSGSNFFGLTQNIILGETPLETNITLERQNGKFQLSFNDVIPDNIDKIRVSLIGHKNILFANDFHTAGGNAAYDELSVATDGREKKERIFTIYSFPTTGSTARITGYDNANVEIFTLDVPEIQIKSNVITKCTGIVFNDDGTISSSTSNLKLGFDYDWDSIIEVTF